MLPSHKTLHFVIREVNAIINVTLTYLIGYVPKAVESLLKTNSDIHNYITRNKDKMRSAYSKHEFTYSNFRFVGIHIWNYILYHLDV